MTSLGPPAGIFTSASRSRRPSGKENGGADDLVEDILRGRASDSGSSSDASALA